MKSRIKGKDQADCQRSVLLLCHQTLLGRPLLLQSYPGISCQWRASSGEESYGQQIRHSAGTNSLSKDTKTPALALMDFKSPTHSKGCLLAHPVPGLHFIVTLSAVPTPSFKMKVQRACRLLDQHLSLHLACI